MSSDDIYNIRFWTFTIISNITIQEKKKKNKSEKILALSTCVQKNAIVTFHTLWLLFSISISFLLRKWIYWTMLLNPTNIFDRGFIIQFSTYLVKIEKNRFYILVSEWNSFYRYHTHIIMYKYITVLPNNIHIEYQIQKLEHIWNIFSHQVKSINKNCSMQF